MFYTYDQVNEFYKVYADPKYNNRYAFIEKMAEYDIDEEKAYLIWQCFDMATEKTWIACNYKSK